MHQWPGNLVQNPEGGPEILESLHRPMAHSAASLPGIIKSPCSYPSLPTFDNLVDTAYAILLDGKSFHLPF